METIFLFEGLGVIGLIIMGLFYFTKPVEKNNFLYGKHPLFMVLAFAVLVTCIILTICGISEFFFHDSPSKIVNWDSDSNIKHDSWWSVLSQFTDPGNLPSANGAGRIVALISALAGIVFISGFLVSSIVNYLSRRSENWRKGMIHYNSKFFNNYVVIIGVNELTAAIVKKSLKRDDVGYVLIQTRQDVEKMRARLDLDLNSKEEDKVVFYYAERTSHEDIKILKLDKAVEIYVLGENIHFENEEDHDAFNITCLENISVYFKEKKIISEFKKKCHVNFEYQSTFTAFKSTHIYAILDKNVEFIPFNVHEIWAKKVLVDNFALVPVGKKGEIKVQNYLPIDCCVEKDIKNYTKKFIGITKDSDKTVHLVIMGMNQMGTALGLQAALLAHFPNAQRNPELRTTITFIDNNARVEEEFFRGRFATMFELCRYRSIKVGIDDFSKEWTDPMTNGRYKHLGENFMDIQWEFIEGNVASDEIKDYLVKITGDADKTTSIAICFNHPQQSIATALYMPELVFKKALQILVYQQNNFDLVNKIATGEKEWKRYEKLRPFGMLEGSYTEDTFDIPMAKLLDHLYSSGKISKKQHDGYEYSPVDDLSVSEKIDISFAQKINESWDLQLLVQKLSNINMVDSIWTKLRSLGLSVEDIGKMPEILSSDNTLELMAKSEHIRWVTERVSMGFRPLDDNDKEYRVFLNPKLSKEQRNSCKRKIIKKSRAHLDICSNKTLNEIDPNSHSNDVNVISYIPQLLKYREWLGIMRIVDERTKSKSVSKLLKKFIFFDNHGNNELAIRFVDDDKHSFMIMDTNITQSQWESVMGDNPSSEKYIDNNKPVLNVSKNDIDDFLKALRKKTGLYFDLPTLDEWTTAAQQSSTYLEGNDNWNKKLWFDKKDSGPCKVRELMDFQNNNLRVYDMLGNTWEWTKTENLDNEGCYYFCGGSWRFKNLQCNLNDEYWYSFWKPILKSDDISFRLVWRFDMDGFDENTRNNIVGLLNAVAHGNADTNYAENKIDISAMLKMVPVGRGYYVMGTENKRPSNDDAANHYDKYPQEWRDDFAEVEETPHHFVKIDKFLISETPVTQRLWNAVMGDTSRTNPSSNIGDEYPQTNVSWARIKNDFLVRLNSLTGKNYRLPTEAEWEYVAKGGHNTDICRGLTAIFDDKNLSDEDKKSKAYQFLHKKDKYNMYSGTNNASELDLRKRTATMPVKQRIPNELGVYDMSGNIWEWCEDFYQTDFYNDCIYGKGCVSAVNGEEYERKGYISNPICNDPTYSAHVFRGGSWRFNAKNCRCTSVNFWIDTDEDDDLGFRLVLKNED